MNVSTRPPEPPPSGKLDWLKLIAWLRDDGMIEPDEADKTIKRFGSTQSVQHPLVRLAAAGLQRKGPAGGHGKPLDIEALTAWLAQRCGMPYLRIDPLKVDVGRVAEVMSLQYAEMRKVLPVNVSADAVTVATSEPFDTGWVSEIESHSRRRVKLVVAK